MRRRQVLFLSMNCVYRRNDLFSGLSYYERVFLKDVVAPDLS